MWQFEYETYLERLHAYYQFTEVIVGSNVREGMRLRQDSRHMTAVTQQCTADAHAKGWADRAGINTTVMDANWIGHGKSGGPRRNTRMLRYLALLCGEDAAHPGLVIAFPGGAGTDDLCTQAQQWDGIMLLRWPALPPELVAAA